MKHSTLLSYKSMSYKRFKTKHSGKFWDLRRTNEGSEQLRMVHNKEFRNLYRLRIIFMAVNSRKLQCWVADIGADYKILGSKTLTLFCLAKRGDGRNFTRFFKKLTGDNIPLTFYVFLIIFLFFCCGAATQRGSWPPHSWGFLDHIQRRTTVGRTPLDEWSARRRDLYLTTHNTHNRQISMPPVGFEPTISAGKRPQTYDLDRAATGTGIYHWLIK